MAPQTMEETGLTPAFVADLALKYLYEKGQTTAADLAETLALPLPKILQPILDYLKKESLVEVKGGSGVAAATYLYVLSEKGANRAKEVMERNGYVGAAPVTLAAYVGRVRAQSIGEVSISFDVLRKAL
jgi:predicted ATPase with chaperone activity